MAGEAVSGRYGAARHAVADEGGPHRHPAPDDRSLVDRLLAGGGDDQAFDWGWGDPGAGGLVTDREPLHDIPELWGPDERSARDSGEPDSSAEKHFPTPRLHGESPLDVSRPADRGDGDRDWSERDWSDRDRDDLGSDDWGAPASDLGPGADGDDQRFGGRDFDRDPLGALSTGRVLADPGPLGDSAADRDVPQPDPLHDVLMDGEHAGARTGSDPLDRAPGDRDRPDRSPLAPPLLNRDPFGGHRPDVDAPREPAEDLDRIRADRDFEQPHRTPGRDPLDRDPLEQRSPERGWQDPRPFADPSDRGLSYADPLDRPRADEDLFESNPPDRGAESGERKLASDPRLRRWADRGRPSGVPGPAAPSPFADESPVPDPFGGDSLATDPGDVEQGRADEGGADHDAAERDDAGQSGAEQVRADRGNPDRFGDDLFGAGPDGRDRADAAPGPRDADPFADPAFTESVHTGRIRIADDDGGPGPERARQEPPAGRDPFDQAPPPGRDPLDVAPDPTTAFAAVAPAAPARRDATEEPALPLEEYSARRRAAEQAAASAEQAASSAAERASAAIAAAARAAEEAEAAADAAAKAADEANEAAEAEVRAIAEAVARGEAPGRQEVRAEAPEPPTQAVPLIAPARAPRRPPLRRPAGPPPRGVRPEEPGRAGGPPPRTAQRSGPGRDGAGRDGAGRDGAGRDGAGRDGAGRDGAGRGGSDGEATAVLTGLDALRDPVRLRGPEQAPAEVTTVTRRRPSAEPSSAADEADDVDDSEHDDEPEERGLVGRLTSRPVIAAVGVGAVLVLAAIVAIFTTAEPEAAPAEAAPAALSAPVEEQAPPAAPAIDPHGPKAVAFLTALRDADIPTSSSGQAETEAAAAICTQLDQGADEAQLARSVPAVLPDVTRGQASDVVDLAQQNYC